MIGKILKKDFFKNKIITFTLFLFIMMAAILASSATSVITELFGSMDNLFEKSSVPHYVQMHSGKIDQDKIDIFSKNNKFVKKQQTVEMLGINGGNLYLKENKESEIESIIENSFVKQNKGFDFLLDTKNEIANVNDGEIGVPIYHMKEYGLKIGDTVKVEVDGFKMDFIIKTFIRDAQMNPSIVTSKRFLVSDNDWEKIKNSTEEIEYLIEFQLNDTEKVTEFESNYQNSKLPQKDTSMTTSLYKLMNSLTDGLVAAVIILISFLLVVIAALCLRFTLITTIEEDYREIGVMKAIGISNKYIRKLYSIKYIAISALACITGYIISIFVTKIFIGNISLYMGSSDKTLLNYLAPMIVSFFVFFVTALFCRLILKRFKKISALEALNTNSFSNKKGIKKGFSLSKSLFSNTNIFLGVKDVFNQIKVYILLCFIYIICIFIMIVPINFLNTMKSPEVVSYMGVGKSDIRIDLLKTNNREKDFEKIENYLKKDKDVTKYSTFVTSSYKFKNADGVYENIKIENGNHSVLPLEYAKGSAPNKKTEIALSTMNATEMEKNVGDSLTVLVEGKEHILTVSGTYQDITNGGKTAKAILPYTSDNILWHIVNIEIEDDVALDQKQDEYKESFGSAKITYMKDYINQTLGGIIKQLKLVIKVAFALSAIVAILITGMFFKMLIAKEVSQIAILKNIGFSYKDIRLQYTTRALLILFIGTISGMFTSVILGQKLASLLLTGVSSMKFTIDPITSFIICPLTLIIAVTVTVFISCTSIKKIKAMLVAE